jgi:large subunit ribosomal protein L9
MSGKEDDMKVIFIEDVPNVARAGEIKDVAAGYGRNYLIPRKLAAMAGPQSINEARAQMEKRVRERAETESEMKQLAAKINGKELVVTAKTGGNEKLYGSVTAEDIAAGLEKTFGVVVDKRKIELPESIRQVGSYDVNIRLGADIVPTVKVTVKDQET